MHDRKMSESNFLLQELAKLNVLDLMEYIHRYVPLQSFRSLHYEEKIRQAALNQKDYICFALATGNILVLESKKINACIEWLTQHTQKNQNYTVIINSLTTIKNIIEEGEKPNPNINSSLLVPNGYQNLHRAKLKHADFRHADLRLSKLRAATLQNSKLQNAKLDFVEMEYANLSNANLSNVTAEYANMAHTTMVNTNLQYAILEGTQLQRADLTGARLLHADLSGANLNGAILKNADLRQVNLVDAQLLSTDFTGANLAGAKFFSKEMLTKENLENKLDRLEQMLSSNPQTKLIRQYIAIDCANQANKLSDSDEKEILNIAYNHSLFKPQSHGKAVSVINKWYGFFRPDKLDYISTKAQLELSRNMSKRS